MATKIYTLLGILAMMSKGTIAESRQLSSLNSMIKSPEVRLGLKCPVELDYSPQCICDFWPYDTFNAYCNASSTQELNAITQTFQLTPIVDHTEVKINLTGSNMSIPANMLSNKTAVSIIIECIGDAAGLVSIDPQAFISSAGKTSAFQISFCDLTDFNFAFLAQLRVLATLRLMNTTVTTMAQMPLMPHLRTLELYAPSGFRKWHNPAQTPWLDTIIINAATDTDEAVIEEITNTLVYYESSLLRLYLVNLGLTKVPPAVRNMTNLNTLDLSYNLITTLPTGSLALMSTVSSLWLHNMPLRTIEPGAFQGNFRSTLVYMVFDKLTTFPRQVFENVLEDMLKSSGSMDLYDNPLLCDDCHLSWLINEKRYLLTRLSGASCSNGTNLLDLDSQSYSARCVKDSATFGKSSSMLLFFISIFSFLAA